MIKHVRSREDRRASTVETKTVTILFISNADTDNNNYYPFVLSENERAFKPKIFSILLASALQVTPMKHPSRDFFSEELVINVEKTYWFTENSTYLCIE